MSAILFFLSVLLISGAAVYLALIVDASFYHRAWVRRMLETHPDIDPVSLTWQRVHDAPWPFYGKGAGSWTDPEESA